MDAKVPRDRRQREEDNFNSPFFPLFDDYSIAINSRDSEPEFFRQRHACREQDPREVIGNGRRRCLVTAEKRGEGNFARNNSPWDFSRRGPPRPLAFPGRDRSIRSWISINPVRRRNDPCKE